MDCHTHVDTVMACIRTRNRAKHGRLQLRRNEFESLDKEQEVGINEDQLE